VLRFQLPHTQSHNDAADVFRIRRRGAQGGLNSGETSNKPTFATFNGHPLAHPEVVNGPSQSNGESPPACSARLLYTGRLIVTYPMSLPAHEPYLAPKTLR
jgi:hypothetical protein